MEIANTIRSISIRHWFEIKVEPRALVIYLTVSSHYPKQCRRVPSMRFNNIMTANPNVTFLVHILFIIQKLIGIVSIPNKTSYRSRLSHEPSPGFEPTPLRLTKLCVETFIVFHPFDIWQLMPSRLCEISCLYAKRAPAQYHYKIFDYHAINQ